MARRTTVVVAGALANKLRNGGEAWVRLSWVLGLRRLGFDAWLWEQIDQPTAEAEAYFRQIVTAHGLGHRAALVTADAAVVCAPADVHLADVADAAQLLVNISGHLTASSLFEHFRRTAYVDIDPGFTQIWHVQGLTGRHLADHDLHFTIGENIGRTECAIPTGGFAWVPVRQPVTLDDWPVVSGEAERFTTVASWRGSYGPIDYDGQRYGQKVHEFRKVIDLPRRAPGRFEIALDIHPADGADRRRLVDGGWLLADPAESSMDTERFRRYVQHSGAEFSVAQGVYVATRSGWFSDRTTRYLASGKPVLVQDTGFRRTLPVGEGLLCFGTLDEAAAAAAVIGNDYAGHATAARSIAEEFFDAATVLANFADRAGVAP